MAPLRFAPHIESSSSLSWNLLISRAVEPIGCICMLSKVIFKHLWHLLQQLRGVAGSISQGGAWADISILNQYRYMYSNHLKGKVEKVIYRCVEVLHYLTDHKLSTQWKITQTPGIHVFLALQHYSESVYRPGHPYIPLQGVCVCVCVYSSPLVSSGTKVGIIPGNSKHNIVGVLL